MNTEIERKYLVYGDFTKYVSKKQKIIQGYLSKDPNRTVRIRLTDNAGFITIKGESDASGMERFEWENEIPLAEAKNLINLCLPTPISKTRHLVNYKNQTFEIDVFHAENEGLIMAEIELENKEQEVILPDFIGQEVTNDARYYNSYLSEHPYKNW